MPKVKYSAWGISFCCVCCLYLGRSYAQSNLQLFHHGEIFRDIGGEIINAHGAGILSFKGIYYMFGEIKKGTTRLVPNQGWEDYRVTAGGVSCYSSRDLIHWKNEGIALASVRGDPSNDLDTGKVIERPKVIYNKQTKKFVMWMHIDASDYSYSQAGLAVSDHPAGPYHYIQSMKPNGNMVRDLTLFQDDNGLAYLVYSSEQNNTMHVCLLGTDYLTPTRTDTRILIGRKREGPALFKNSGKYYLISSGCTGWSPNPAIFAVADHPLGPYKEMGNPCIGPDADSTFYSQSSYVLPIPNRPDSYIFIADRWNKSDLPDSRYIWLPLFVKEGKVKILWKAEDLSP